MERRSSSIHKEGQNGVHVVVTVRSVKMEYWSSSNVGASKWHVGRLQKVVNRKKQGVGALMFLNGILEET